MKRLIFFLLLPVLGFAQDKAEILKKMDTDLVIEKKPSIIGIPIDISIGDLQNQINEGLPDLIFEDNSFSGDDLKIKVWRKGNLIFTENKEGTLTYEVPLKVWAQKRTTVLGISHEPSTDFEIKIKFSSKFNLTPDYEIETKTKGLSYTWITKPVLKVGFVDIPISAIIGRVLTSNFPMFASQIDETIKEGYPLKPYMLDAWNMVKQPFQVSEEYNTWVLADPVGIYFTEPQSVGMSIKSTIGIKLFLETYVGTPTQVIEKVSEIPKLKKVSSIPEEFEIQLLNVISYPEANNISRKMFIGETFEFKNGKYKIVVTDLNILNSGDRLVLDIKTKGSFKGTLRIEGTPVYSEKRGEVVLTKVDLDVKTKNILHKAASWLLEGTLVRNIEESFGMPVGDIIQYTKENIRETVNTEYVKGVKMSGDILDVTPDKVVVTDEGILASVIAKARVQLVIKGL